MSQKHDTPELQAVVKETLISIIRAVKEAQHETADTGAVINPIVENRERAHMSGGRGVDDVRFDVAVAAGAERKAGGGLVIHVLSLGKENRDANSAASRVNFSIPVSWPPPDSK